MLSILILTSNVIILHLTQQNHHVVDPTEIQLENMEIRGHV